MSREIKFRAWDRATNSFADDWKLYLNGGVSICDTWATAAVDLMQYTGLKDKDGVEIYCGDIVKVVATENDLNQRGATDGLIVQEFMGNMCFCFLNGETGTPIYPAFISHEKTVIGNIYENPEMLK